MVLTELVKPGKKGQVSIPRSILKKLVLEGDIALLVDTTGDGAIVLRPAAAYPVEIEKQWLAAGLDSHRVVCVGVANGPGALPDAAVR